MFKKRSAGKKEGKTMLDGVKIKIDCDCKGLDEAIKKVNQLIALLKEVQQIADSLEVDKANDLIAQFCVTSAPPLKLWNIVENKERR